MYVVIFIKLLYDMVDYAPFSDMAYHSRGMYVCPQERTFVIIERGPSKKLFGSVKFLSLVSMDNANP